jgi:AraC-like DNA-binding protein
MLTRLTRGQFFGHTVRRRMVNGLCLSENRYAPGARLPSHSHEHGYFCLIRRGHFEEEYAGQRRSCGPMMVAFHPPSEVHAERFADEETWSFNVEVTKPWLALWPDAAGCFDRSAAFQGGAIANLALRLYAEFQNDDTAADLAVEGLALEILANGWRQVLSRTDRSPPRWLEQVRDLLRQSFATPVSLAELARQAGVHPVHLAAAFRRHYGATVGQYVRQRRIDYARIQLSSSPTPLAEIALTAGFADQSHFSRVFKRLTGFTPARFRQNARLDSQR